MKKCAMLLFSLWAVCAWSNATPTITVDFTNQGTPIQTKFGHNTMFWHDANDLWNPSLNEGHGGIKPNAKNAIQVEISQRLLHIPALACYNACADRKPVEIPAAGAEGLW